jgi:hypothetical protein
LTLALDLIYAGRAEALVTTRYQRHVLITAVVKADFAVVRLLI